MFSGFASRKRRGAALRASTSRTSSRSGWSRAFSRQARPGPGAALITVWSDAADLIVKGIEGAISAKAVPYDFKRLMGDAALRKCSEFGEDIVKHMG